MSSGLQANFGSMVKSIHVGVAACNGLRAAQLAAAGIEAAPEVFSGNGFIRAFSGGESADWPDHLQIGDPFVLANPGFEQKRYPCCYMLHRMIEATLRLRRDHAITLEDVVRAAVEMPFGGTTPLIHPRPKLGLSALFSGPYAVLAALADGRADLRSFTDAQVLRPAIQDRLGDVTLTERAPRRPAESIGDAPVSVTLTLRGGRAVTETITVSPGSAHDPLTSEQLRGKWIDCLHRANQSADDDRLGAFFDQGCSLPNMADAGRWLRAIAETVTRAPPT
jgi:2-methylcitrate dehydratase PrpD